MVKIKKIFDKNEISKENDSCKLAKELSEKIGEYPNSSTFITIGDAILTGSDISLIENEKDSNSKIERDFIFA